MSSTLRIPCYFSQLDRRALDCSEDRFPDKNFENGISRNRCFEKSVIAIAMAIKCYLETAVLIRSVECRNFRMQSRNGIAQNRECKT